MPTIDAGLSYGAELGLGTFGGSVQSTTHLVYLHDHADRAVLDLLAQDRDKPRMTAFARALGKGAQAMEDELFSLIADRSPRTASGAQLDQWGAIAGERRGPLEDAEYRRFIYARVLVNRNAGSIDELLRIFATITAPGTVEYTLLPPGGFVLTVTRKSWLRDRMRRRIRRMMADAKPLARTMVLVEALEGSFGLGDEFEGFDTGPLARIL
jgi:hypothetical protein